VLGGGDGQHRAGEPLGEAVEGPCPLDFAQRRRGGQVETELHPRVGGVDALATRAGGPGELFDQLVRGHREATGSTGARWHVQVLHTISVPYFGGIRRWYIRHMPAQLLRSRALSDVPSTLLDVTVLGYDDQLVEVEAVAAITDGEA
jgi:hypothetical protein